MQINTQQMTNFEVKIHVTLFLAVMSIVIDVEVAQNFGLNVKLTTRHPFWICAVNLPLLPLLSPPP